MIIDLTKKRNIYMMKNGFYMFLSTINNFGRGVLSAVVYVACTALLISWHGGLAYYFVLSIPLGRGWTACFMAIVSLGWTAAIVYKFIYFKNNCSFILNKVDVDKANLFKKFLQSYLETFAWLLTPTAMLFIKLYMSLNTYDFFFASFALLAVLWLFSLNKVIYLCFKIYLCFIFIDNIMDENCYNWAKLSNNIKGKINYRVNNSIFINRAYSLGNVRFYFSKSDNKGDDNTNKIFVDNDIASAPFASKIVEIDHANNIIDLKHVSKLMVNRDLIDKDAVVKIDAELFNYFTYFSLIKGLIPIYTQKKFFSKVRKLLNSIGVIPENIELLIKELVVYNDKTVVSPTGKLANINNYKNRKFILKYRKLCGQNKCTF
nr:hypothetical protein [Grifola frondosa]